MAKVVFEPAKTLPVERIRAKTASDPNSTNLLRRGGFVLDIVSDWFNHLNVFSNNSKGAKRNQQLHLTYAKGVSDPEDHPFLTPPFLRVRDIRLFPAVPNILSNLLRPVKGRVNLPTLHFMHGLAACLCVFLLCEVLR